MVVGSAREGGATCDGFSIFSVDSAGTNVHVGTNVLAVDWMMRGQSKVDVVMMILG